MDNESGALRPADDRATHEQSQQAVSAVPVGIPSAVWVIIRSMGEYSDRDETPIRYCLTEREAQEAVALASIEAQRDADKKPPYRHESTYGLQLPDGSWLPKDTYILDPVVRQTGAKVARLPDAEAIEARNAAWAEEYDAACMALGHVDPWGSWTGDGYYYAPVTLWAAQGMETRQDGDAQQAPSQCDDSPVPQGCAPTTPGA